MSQLASASDTSLIVLISRWQEDALAEVYRRHGGAVHNLSSRVLAAADLADEVTQEVFIDLWNRPEQFDTARGTLRTFLLTKAHGKAVDLIRSEVARRSREQRSAYETANAGYDLDRYAWDLASADQVKRAFEVLSDDERRSIEMAYFEGMTYKEVAARLGAPEGTVKSRIRSGLRRMRSALSDQQVGTP